MKDLVLNKKALRDYQILKKIEAGICLKGWEVKSLDNHQGSLDGAYAIEKNGEMWLEGLTISPWKYGYNKEEYIVDTPRKLLLKKKETENLTRDSKEKGFALIPLKIYRNNKNLIKVELSLARGKKKFDKREAKRRKDMQRRVEMDRKQYNF